MIEDLKKLLPREKVPVQIPHYNPHLSGYNEAIQEGTACLPSLVEYIYADLREKLTEKYGDGINNPALVLIESTESGVEQRPALDEVLSLLTPNK